MIKLYILNSPWRRPVLFVDEVLKRKPSGCLIQMIFHWDVLGSEKMVQGATNYNLNISRFLRGLSLNY